MIDLLVEFPVNLELLQDPSPQEPTFYPEVPQLSLESEQFPSVPLEQIQRIWEFCQNQARNCQQLLAQTPKILNSATRLEYCLATGYLDLYLDPLAWFDHHPNKALRITKGREWVKTIREHTQPRDIRHDPILEPVKEYCLYGDSCKFPQNSNQCGKEHGTFWCNQILSRRGGPSRRCGWFSTDELLLLSVSDQYFIVQARNEPQRDLLLLPNPRPPQDLQDFKVHYSNSELVVMPFFWFEVVQVAHRFANILRSSDDEPGLISPPPFTSVSLNFGTWETAQSLDHRATDCHGHAHLELTGDYLEKLAESFSFLEGRFSQPVDYREKNANDLETGRLLGAMLESLETSVNTRFANLETSVNTRFTNLETSVNDNFARLDANLNKILSFLEGQSSVPVNTAV